MPPSEGFEETEAKTRVEEREDADEGDEREDADEEEQRADDRERREFDEGHQQETPVTWIVPNEEESDFLPELLFYLEENDPETLTEDDREQLRVDSKRARYRKVTDLDESRLRSEVLDELEAVLEDESVSSDVRDDFADVYEDQLRIQELSADEGPGRPRSALLYHSVATILVTSGGVVFVVGALQFDPATMTFGAGLIGMKSVVDHLFRGLGSFVPDLF